MQIEESVIGMTSGALSYSDEDIFVEEQTVSGGDIAFYNDFVDSFTYNQSQMLENQSLMIVNQEKLIQDSNNSFLAIIAILALLLGSILVLSLWLGGRK